MLELKIAMTGKIKAVFFNCIVTKLNKNNDKYVWIIVKNVAKQRIQEQWDDNNCFH